MDKAYIKLINKLEGAKSFTSTMSSKRVISTRTMRSYPSKAQLILLQLFGLSEIDNPPQEIFYAHRLTGSRGDVIRSTLTFTVSKSTFEGVKDSEKVVKLPLGWKKILRKGTPNLDILFYEDDGLVIKDTKIVVKHN